jgi:hypothetical protein
MNKKAKALARKIDKINDQISSIMNEYNDAELIEWCKENNKSKSCFDQDARDIMLFPGTLKDNARFFKHLQNFPHDFRLDEPMTADDILGMIFEALGDSKTSSWSDVEEFIERETKNYSQEIKKQVYKQYLKDSPSSERLPGESKGMKRIFAS